MMALSRKKADSVFQVKAHAQKVTCLDVGDTGGVLVTGGQDCQVNLWAFGIGSDKCFTTDEHNAFVDCVRFTDNDNFVYSSNGIGIIKQWDINTDSKTTYHGHMKSVKTLDFHPRLPYFVSGSYDTTIRLWDMKRSKESLAQYRAHIATVNHVQFSPDGNWVASAGAEGTVLIWEVRMSRAIKKFEDITSAVSCIQFHPSEYLVAAGRTNGTVDIFDLDANKILRRITLSLGTVKCCLFSEDGEWLYVGTDNGVAVVVWETERNLDFIQATWTNLFSMKLLSSKLLCGSLDGTQVQVHSFNVELIGKVQPVAAIRQQQQINPYSNINISNGGGNQHVSLSSLNMSNNNSNMDNDQRAFLYAQQKERGKIGLRNLQSATAAVVPTAVPTGVVGPLQGTDEDSGSPSSNLSIEMAEDLELTLTQSRLNHMVDEDSDTLEFAYPDNRFELLKGVGGGGGGGVGEVGGRNGNGYDSWRADADEANHSLSVASSSSPTYDDASAEFRIPTTATRNVEFKRGGHLDYNGLDGPADEFLNNSQFFNSGHSDLGYRSDTGGDARDASTAEDFPVNNAPPPNYAPKSSLPVQTNRLARQKTSIGFVAPNRTQSGGGGGQSASTTGGGKLTQAKRMSSLSVTNLSDLTDSHSRENGQGKFRPKGGSRAQNANRFRGGSPARLRSRNSNSNNNNNNDYNANINKENLKNKNGNFKVEFFGKPPTRSRSTFDMRSAGVGLDRDSGPATGRREQIPVHTSRLPRQSGGGYNNSGGEPYNNHHHQQQQQRHYGGGESMETQEINYISNGHERVLHELCNRHATLKMNKDVAIMQDIYMAIRQIARLKDQGSLVDMLGAILEKSNAMTLDLAVVLLPELYELLQSDKKFHCTRACDTLRVILTNFLPLIKSNSDPWAAHSLGVDISSEERWKKCNECRKWLLMIRSIPDNRNVSNALSQLQNLIVDI